MGVTTLHADTEKEVTLHFSTVDELAVWINGEFNGFDYRDGYQSPGNDWNAWYDFWKNDQHAGSPGTYLLKPGANHIVVRVRNGQFASGGFFARLEE